MAAIETMNSDGPVGAPGREGLELRIRQLEQELEDCRRKRENLAQTLAAVVKIGHALNNVWITIAGNLELIERRTTDAKLRRLASSASIAVTRGPGLTERLLALSNRGDLPSEDDQHDLAADFPVAAPSACTDITILLVDDDPDVLKLVADSLRGDGYNVIAVSCGRHALDVLEDGNSVDLMVVDFAMPELDGLEVARRARRCQPFLRVLFMTGYAGACEFRLDDKPELMIKKPFKLDLLTSFVKKSLSSP